MAHVVLMQLLVGCIVSLASVAADAARVLEVRTADELSTAIAADISHIVVTQHLDLTTLPAQQAAQEPAKLTPSLALQSLVVRLT
jgi:hypothetical protein